MSQTQLSVPFDSLNGAFFRAAIGEGSGTDGDADRMALDERRIRMGLVGDIADEILSSVRRFCQESEQTLCDEF